MTTLPAYSKIFGETATFTVDIAPHPDVYPEAVLAEFNKMIDYQVTGLRLKLQDEAARWHEGEEL